MATYKGVGYDTTNGRTRTGTSSDDISFDAQITATDALSVTGGTTTDTLSVTGDASVGGNLDVAGDIISRGAVDLVIQDNFIDLNFANSTTTAEAGGLTIQMNRTNAFTAGTITTFVAGSAGVSNPTFTYTDAGGSSTLTAGDIVVIDGAGDSENNGIYVVSSVSGASFPQTVTIKGVGTTATDASTPFAQTQFTAATGNTATGFKTDLFVQLVADGSSAFTDSGGSTFAKGTFLTAYHTAATESSFSADGGYSTVESTLQSAYNGGNTIATTSGSDVPITFTLQRDGSGLSVQGSSSGVGQVSIGGTTAVDSYSFNATGAASTINSTGQNLSIKTTTSGTLQLESAAALDINGVAGTLDLTGGLTAALSGAASSITSTSQDLTIGTATSGELKLDAVALLNIDAGANLDVDVTGTVDILASSTFSIDGTGTSNVTATSGDLTVSTATSGDLLLASAGEMDLTAGANLDVNVTGTIDVLASSTFSIDGTGASNVTATSGDLTLSTATSGSLVLDGVALVDINAGANLDIDVTGTFDMLSSGAFSIDGTGASNVSAASGNLSLSTSTSGDVDISSAGDIDLDGINIQADATGALSLQGATSSDLTLAANTGSTQTLTIAASNADGSNVADLDIDADGAITIDSVAATSITAAGNSNATLQTGTASTATGEAQIVSSFPQFVKIIKANASGVAAGDAIFLGHDGVDGLVCGKVDADTIGTARFAGVALESKTAGQDCRVAISGVVKVVTSTTAFNGANHRGQPVYVSTDVGKIQPSAPTGSGDVVFQVGLCVGGSGTSWEVLLQPQFIMEIG